MRAAVVTVPGQSPEYADHPDPVSGDGSSLVEVSAAAITPLDQLCASGTSYFGTPATPYVPGVQGVGVVRSSGAWPEGTRVWFATDAGMRPGDGSMAQLCAVPDEDLVPLPEGVDVAQAAALGLSAVAAWMSLTARAGMRPGERVLVLGGGGVVGQVALQAARLLGASRVVAAARSDGARERSRAAGADEVVPLAADDDVAGLAARFETALGGHADVVVDPLCGLPASAAGLVLGEGGRLVNLGSSAGPTATFDSATLRSRSAAILGYTNNALTKAERRDSLTAVLTHAAGGTLRVDHTVLPLSEIRQAWAVQRDGVGRVVLRP